MKTKRPHPVIFIIIIFIFVFSPAEVLRYLSGFFLIFLLISKLSVIFFPKLLRVTRFESKTKGIRHQPVQVKIRIENRSLIPLRHLILHDATGGLFTKNSTFQFSLRPFEKMQVEYTCESHQRGVYNLGPVRVKGRGFWGIYAWEREYPVYSDLLIYPALYPLLVFNEYGMPVGNINIKNFLYEDITRFRNLREYIPGDDIKRIHWKASAKTNTLYTQEFDSTLAFEALVVLMLSQEDYPLRYRSTLVERAVETTASLVALLVQQQQEFACLLLGKQKGLVSSENETRHAYFPKQRGYTHGESVLEALASIDMAPGRSDPYASLFTQGYRLPHKGQLFIVTPIINENIKNALFICRRRGIRTCLFLLESSVAPRSEVYSISGVRVLRVPERGEELLRATV